MARSTQVSMAAVAAMRAAASASLAFDFRSGTTKKWL